MLLRRFSSWVCGVGLVLFFALVPLVTTNQNFRYAVGDLVPLLVATVTFILMARNAVDSRGHTRLFWGLMAASMVMWWFNQAGWVWFEVILHQSVPDPFEGDIILFLHFV